MPPDNGGYMVAAYAVTAVILVGYAVGLLRRASKAVQRKDAETPKSVKREG